LKNIFTFLSFVSGFVDAPVNSFYDATHFSTHICVSDVFNDVIKPQ
jgi:hypothetical protein